MDVEQANKYKAKQTRHSDECEAMRDEQQEERVKRENRQEEERRFKTKVMITSNE